MEAVECQSFHRVFFFLLYRRPLKNTSDISLMDDAQNEWGDDEPSDAKRFRVRRKHIIIIIIILCHIFSF